ncbi:MAG TPA: N-acetylmuramoyl-L-alanine amidase [Phycisphaerales bacterium]|nr:N-acetylmuramoyl-L-alanine amidase [Phycisphaerales bacterium]
MRATAAAAVRRLRSPPGAIALSALLLLAALAVPRCAAPPRVEAPSPGAELVRRGDEIVICGRLFHTGAPVVLWTDPDGYDAYRTDRRFAPPEEAPWAPGRGPATPNRYDARSVPGGADDLDALRRHVDQFVIHYDAAGTSRQCFKILHDLRGLSIHFMIDIDGTIYQTLDVKDRAWHATIANGRSVGVELAHIGAYAPESAETLRQWYAEDGAGTRITIPVWQGDGGIRTPGFVGRPASSEPVSGVIQGQTLVQYDFTPEQYDSLAKLTAALCAVLPQIRCDYPRDEHGRPLARAMTPDEFAAYRGLLGHSHIQQNKVDPGPAFDWDRLRQSAQLRMRRESAVSPS